MLLKNKITTLLFVLGTIIIFLFPLATSVFALEDIITKYYVDDIDCIVVVDEALPAHDVDTTDDMCDSEFLVPVYNLEYDILVTDSIIATGADTRITNRNANFRYEPGGTR